MKSWQNCFCPAKNAQRRQRQKARTDGIGHLHTRKDKGRKKRKMAKKLFSLLMALTLLAALALPAAFAEDYLDIINIADDNQSASYDLHKDTSDRKSTRLNSSHSV